jgi:hypothetical protein
MPAPARLMMMSGFEFQLQSSFFGLPDQVLDVSIISQRFSAKDIDLKISAIIEMSLSYQSVPPAIKRFSYVNSVSIQQKMTLCV